MQTEYQTNEVDITKPVENEIGVTRPVEITSPGKKILIVDDEEDICTFLSRNFNDRNFATSFSLTLKGALQLIEAEEPDVLLLDNHLPDGLGVDFVGKIKSQYPKIKIVLITAHDSSQDRMKAYSSGVNYFLSKPFSLSEINKVVDSQLSGESDE